MRRTFAGGRPDNIGQVQSSRGEALDLQGVMADQNYDATGKDLKLDEFARQGRIGGGQRGGRLVEQ
jgi:hypothetical protein